MRLGTLVVLLVGCGKAPAPKQFYCASVTSEMPRVCSPDGCPKGDFCVEQPVAVCTIFKANTRKVCFADRYTCEQLAAEGPSTPCQAEDPAGQVTSSEPPRAVGSQPQSRP